MASNPRKFSEKIALHNQKQAEETAAFESIMRDVSGVTRVPTMQKQHLQLQQNISTQYRAGSLPNVNQMVTNSSHVDLQTALQHLEDMRGPMPNRMDNRFHASRDRGRPVGPHRRGFPIDKSRTNCSPYGSAYLSPPPDTSWRRLFRHLNGANLSRTNSDSAIHTSTMGPSDLDPMGSPTTPPAHRRIAEMVGENVHGDPMMKGYWDPKKLQSRPKSCEVPNINIYPSAEEENNTGQMGHVPISSNTGSLPDLTVVHFQSPLPTPIDPEEGYGCQAQGNLSPTSAHMQGMCPQTGSPTAQSPNQRRRPGGPSPLVLSGGPQSPQMRMAHSPPGSVVNIDPSKLQMDPRLKQQYLLYLQQQQQRHGASHQHPNPSQSHPSPSSNHIQSRVPQVCVTACDQNDTEPSLSQYRNSVSDSNCQSPTSPRSQTSYSPSQSPGLTPSWNSNSPFADHFQLQQQQQQTNALQHQFEQFNMSPENHYTTADTSLLQNGVSSAAYTMSQQNSSNMSQAMMHGLTGSQEFHQQQQPQYFHPQPIDLNNPNSSRGGMNSAQHLTNHHHMTTNNKIPDIIFTDHRTGNEEVSLDDISTNAMFDGGFIIGEQGIWVQSQKGADDLMRQQDFAKDIGNAITGMPEGFDTDLFPSVEALKAGLDPLDLQELQMLTDPNNITDPATEESFKLDRL